MTDEKVPRSGYSEGRHDDGTRVARPCRNRGDCEGVRVKAACWDAEFSDERVLERLAECDELVLRRLRAASLDVSLAPIPRRSPWPQDAQVPRFYPPKGVA